MEPTRLSQRQFDRFRDFIYQQSGIRVDSSRITLMSNRIRRRLKAGEFADFDSYYQHLTSSGGVAELEQFLDAITTNETQFFRTPNHFEWFKETFLAEVFQADTQGRRQKTLRIWSAACSTGEEAYSLAICLAENALRLRGWKTTVIGTDISEAVLRDARSGCYAERSLELVTAAQRKRYFDLDADGRKWKLRSSIRSLVEFKHHNLMRPLRLPPFDCIFIRNVLIYFDRASKSTVVEHLVHSLAKGGYLVVGPSEGIYDMLAPLVKRSAYLYQKT